jgi:hypothetical protein
MTSSYRAVFATVIVVVLVINAACRSVQIVQSLFHLGPYAQFLATQGKATSQALAQSDGMIASNVLALLTWWAVAGLAWVVRSVALSVSP